jgi:TonB family protein
MDAVPLTRAEPIFEVPEGVKELRLVLKFRIDEHGRVLNPEVVESSNSGFDQAAIKAVRFWQFLPKLKNGKPVAAPAQLPFRMSRK